MKKVIYLGHTFREDDEGSSESGLVLRRGIPEGELACRLSVRYTADEIRRIISATRAEGMISNGDFALMYSVDDDGVYAALGDSSTFPELVAPVHWGFTYQELEFIARTPLQDGYVLNKEEVEYVRRAAIEYDTIDKRIITRLYKNLFKR